MPNRNISGYVKKVSLDKFIGLVRYKKIKNKQGNQFSLKLTFLPSFPNEGKEKNGLTFYRQVRFFYKILILYCTINYYIM